MAKVVLSVRVDAEVAHKLDSAAKFLRLSRSDLLQDILVQFVARNLDAERAGPPKSSPVLAPACEEPSRVEAPRVLLAEDNPISSKVVELILGNVGIDVTSVTNGAEAVEAWAQGRFDLILMDIKMPVMDGLTAIRAIRSAEAATHRDHTPIWAISSDALPEHQAAALGAGADGHLSKPVSAAALVKAVDEAWRDPLPQPDALRA